MALYHGGVPGLEPGDWLLPPSVTGVFSVSRYDRVYMTDALWLAAAKAWRYSDSGGADGGGHVYEVEPIGGYEPARAAPCASWMASRARVIKRVHVTKDEMAASNKLQLGTGREKAEAREFLRQRGYEL